MENLACRAEGRGPKGPRAENVKADATQPGKAFVFYYGEKEMAGKGSKDKGRKEQQKKAQRTPKEKRKLRREKKNK